MREEAVGTEFYDWLTNSVIHTDRDLDRIYTDDLWNAAQEASNSVGPMAFGFTKTAFSQSVKKVFNVAPPKRGKVGGGANKHIWVGLRWRDEKTRQGQLAGEEEYADEQNQAG